MKYILNILFVVAILMGSCKKQEVIEKANTSTFEMKSGTSTTPTGTGDVKDDGGIIETEDEDDKKKKGPKKP